MVAACYLLLLYVTLSMAIHVMHVHTSVRGHFLGGVIVPFDGEGQGPLLGGHGKLVLVLLQLIRLVAMLIACAALSTWHREVVGPYQTGYNLPSVSSIEMTSAREQAKESLQTQIETDRTREQAKFVHAAYQVALHETEANQQVVHMAEQARKAKAGAAVGGTETGVRTGLGAASGART